MARRGTLVVNPNDWLDEHGNFPDDNPRLRRNILRIAQFIEYGGTLRPGESRETLMECKRRPGRKPCLGLMWVYKDERDNIIAYCPACNTDEAVIHDWQDTLWADGMMEPLPPLDESEPGELN